jgi:hypothetical protein
MKHTIPWILILVIACSMCWVVAYQTAYHRGYYSGYRQGSVTGLTAGNFTESLILYVSLQKLRSGDISDATDYMETTLFGRANAFFKFRSPIAGKASQWVKSEGLLQLPDIATARGLAKGLSVYRATYRTNSADWDDAEKSLETQIAKIKSDDAKAWASIVVTN